MARIVFDNEIFLLPREADKAVFQYSPTLTISCVLPSTSRRMVLSQNGGTEILDLTTPELIFVENLWKSPDCNGSEVNRNIEPCACRHCSPRPRFYSEYHLYALNTEIGKVLIKPYRLSNVSESGQICWGNQRWGYHNAPDNLRHANTVYWQASFNMDLWEIFKKHKENGCDAIPHTCANYSTPPIGTKCHIKHKCEAFKNAQALARGGPLVNLCTINKNHNCDNFRFIHSQISERYQGPIRTCNPEKECLCCAGACLCTQACRCCTGTCRCNRGCPCCDRGCGCRCRCDLGIRFKEFLKTYAPSKDEAPWTSGTIIWGEKFITFPKHVDAIFVSSEPSLLEKIPKEKHRITFDGEEIVAGFASRSITGWDVNIEGEIYPINSEDVNICALNGSKLSRSRPIKSNIEEETEETEETETEEKSGDNWFDEEMEDIERARREKERERGWGASYFNEEITAPGQTMPSQTIIQVGGITYAFEPFSYMNAVAAEPIIGAGAVELRAEELLTKPNTELSAEVLPAPPKEPNTEPEQF